MKFQDWFHAASCCEKAVLKEHGFRRAVLTQRNIWALAAEVDF